MSMENASSAGSSGNTIDFLEKRIAENPDSMLFARLADCYLKTERIDDAIRVCEEGIKKHPYYATGHFVLGKSYLASKMFEQAEKEFKRVLLFDSKFLAAHKMYGDLMREIGWENTCEMSYKKILKIDPLDESARREVERASRKTQVSPEPAAAEHPGTAPQTSTEPGQAGVRETPDEVKISDETLSPIAVSPEEEEILFEEGESLPVEATAGEEQVEADVSGDLDEKQAEEFSYILDDIFKDEGDEEDSGPANGDLSTPQTVSGNGQEHATEPLATDTATETATATTTTETEKPKVEPVTTVESGPIAPDTPVTTPELSPFDDAEEEMPVAPAPAARPAVDPASVMVKAGKKKSDKIVTPTLGEIYAAQGQYSKAIDVFETLIKKSPENEFYVKKLELLRQKLDESEN